MVDTQNRVLKILVALQIGDVQALRPSEFAIDAERVRSAGAVVGKEASNLGRFFAGVRLASEHIRSQPLTDQFASEGFRDLALL